MSQRGNNTGDELLLRAARMAEAGAMSASAMHELRQPLLGIKGFAQLLRDESDGAVKARSENILQQVARIESILQRQRHFLENDEHERGPVDLSALAKEAIELTSHHLTRCRVKLQTELAPLPKVDGYRRQLVHALVNLVANAADAVEVIGGGAVKVSTFEEAGRVFFEVADWGCGIPAAAEGQLFTPFFTTKGAERGTGLGLVVCEKVAKNHGGTVERVPVRGTNAPRTCFRLSLPREPARQPSRQEARGTVLVVDDEPVVRTVLVELLSPEGYELVEAGSAEEALELLGKRGFDLLISDKNLPGMDGLKLVESARRLHPEMRAILITGYPSLATARMGLELGVLDYVSKPFEDVAVIREKVAAAIEAKRRAAPVAAAGARVLVFEKDEKFSRRLAEALEKLGRTAVVASRIDEVRRDAKAGFSAAVVTWETAGSLVVLEELRALLSMRPLVLFTDQVSLEKMQASIRLGAKACIPKLWVGVDALAQELGRVVGQG